MTILYDSAIRGKPARTFAAGLGRPTDTHGNPLPTVPYTAADAAWWAAETADAPEADGPDYDALAASHAAREAAESGVHAW